MTQREEGIAYRLEQVKSTLTAVCIRRQSTVELVAVSKTFPAEAVLEAVNAGQSVRSDLSTYVKSLHTPEVCLNRRPTTD